MKSKIHKFKKIKLLFTLTALFIYGFTAAQTQIGLDIDGEAANDQSGYSVSMPDANTLAVGAPYNAGNGTDAGHVRIYTWNGSSWVQKGADIDGEAANDRSGFSVSMPDANTLAIGAIANGGNGTNAGHVRIYSWNGSSWVQKGADIDGEAAYDQSGYSVSMPDANTLAVGAPFNDGNGSNAGHVRIYSWNGSSWVQKGADIDGEAANDNSGWSVSMPDANTLAVGAIGNDGNGSNAGHVRIYTWNGSSWVQKGADIDGEAANDNSGWSVSMPDANTLAIGALGNAGNGSYAGHVRIYTWNGSSWVQKGADIDGEAAYDQSGYSVSMPDANTLAVGAPFNAGNGSYAGHVRIYIWNGSSWVQKGADIDGEAANDQSGYSVSMPDANTLAVGAYGNDGNGTDAGHVRVYSICTPATGTDVQTACNSYLWIDGNTYTANNTTAKDTLVGAAANGCDSIVTLNLTITTVDTSVTQAGTNLSANELVATYQWLDCDNNYAVIPGETFRTYYVLADGNYAVEVTYYGCADTSSCYNVIVSSVAENNINNNITIYPNPVKNQLTITAENEKINSIKIIDVTGKILKSFTENTTTINVADLAKGLYILQIQTEKGIGTKRFIKE